MGIISLVILLLLQVDFSRVFETFKLESDKNHIKFSVSGNGSLQNISIETKWDRKQCNAYQQSERADGRVRRSENWAANERAYVIQNYP